LAFSTIFLASSLSLTSFNISTNFPNVIFMPSFLFSFYTFISPSLLHITYKKVLFTM
jgi:hypothetical protein